MSDIHPWHTYHRRDTQAATVRALLLKLFDGKTSVFHVVDDVFAAGKFENLCNTGRKELKHHGAEDGFACHRAFAQAFCRAIENPLKESSEQTVACDLEIRAGALIARTDFLYVTSVVDSVSLSSLPDFRSTISDTHLNR